MSSLPTRRECALGLASGRREECPGPSCELWHDGACVLAAIGPELRRSPALACHLVELEVALHLAATSDAEARARSIFNRRLNAEQAAESAP
jgi:hypothetical protein